MEEKKPKVGVGAIIVKNNQVLLAKRIGSHGANTWGSVGGHLEYKETPRQALIREAKEELGIQLTKISFLCCTNFVIEDKHYIDLGFSAQIKSGTPQIKEKHKIAEVKWFDLNKIPKNLFPPIKRYLEALKTKKAYFET
ncbi:NUDIX domain-containing protein [Candidatus Beckwithbacteria bacterium]|nr:NUDIX domain-containing protein [Candidatus Beckwithbacteria bacterium]